MRKPCTFEDLPAMFKEHIVAVCDTFEVLKCKRIDDKEFKCFVKDDNIIGLFSYHKDYLQENVSCTWLNPCDIELFSKAIQESTRP